VVGTTEGAVHVNLDIAHHQIASKHCRYKERAKQLSPESCYFKGVCGHHFIAISSHKVNELLGTPLTKVR
jgi:hypothetical protein